MVNEKLRKAMANYCEDNALEESEQPLIFDNHAYDNSIVGISNDGRIVYDYSSMVQEFMNDEDCSEEEAIEWIEYNTMRSLPYAGAMGPIIITSNVEDILERYGEEECSNE